MQQQTSEITKEQLLNADFQIMDYFTKLFEGPDWEQLLKKMLNPKLLLSTIHICDFTNSLTVSYFQLNCFSTNYCTNLYIQGRRPAAGNDSYKVSRKLLFSSPRSQGEMHASNVEWLKAHPGPWASAAATTIRGGINPTLNTERPHWLWKRAHPPLWLLSAYLSTLGRASSSQSSSLMITPWFQRLQLCFMLCFILTRCFFFWEWAKVTHDWPESVWALHMNGLSQSDL